MPSAWRSMVVTCAAGSILLAVAPAALGHAAYKDSDPADESTVSTVPGEIWAEFTEPPSDASYMEVFDPCGRQVDLGDSRNSDYRVYISVDGAAAGEYVVEFFVNSTIDNHNTRGKFTFTVTDGDACPGAEEPDEEREGDAGRVKGERADDDGAASNVDQDASGDVTQEGVAVGGNRNRKAVQRTERRPAREDRNADLAPVAVERQPPEEPGIFEDIPLGALALGLLMSAGIGAVGGLIYAGIMGYTR